MRVLHVVPALFDGDAGLIGGAERYALELARRMADEVPTALVAFGDEERRAAFGRLRVRIIGNPWYVRGQRNNPVSPSLLAELLQADVVHCHQTHILTSSFAALACRLSGRRVFTTDHGGGGWDVSAWLPTSRWYHAHLHVSEYSRKISGHGNKPWARVILGGVDTAKFAPDESISRDGTVLFVGRLLPHKGIDDLINAVDRQRRLEIIGRAHDGGYLEHLRRIAAGKRVVFRHDCDDAGLIEAYRRSSCVVLPSVYRSYRGYESGAPELLGQVLLEAMACGSPVICTAVAGMPEIVEDQVTGFVVPPNDPAALGRKIRWICEHPAESGAMGRAARRRVLENFTWPAVVRRCLDIYTAGKQELAASTIVEIRGRPLAGCGKGTNGHGFIGGI
jgi:alpha-maltose-1-phosphate synthase